MNDKEIKDYYNVPIYIEKAVKKLFKLKSQQNELISQIKDYMEHHNIPVDTPLYLLKFVPEDDIDPNQIKFDI